MDSKSSAGVKKMQIRSFYPFLKEQQKLTFKVYIKVIHLNSKNPFKILPKL